MASRGAKRRGICCCLLLCGLLAPRVLVSQERGAVALGEAVLGLGVNTRVLMVGAHPDDEDTDLIAWLSRGRHVKTAYLSLTRGDGGQNLIGNELGEALGVIRTEELLAARRIDGADQYFTRAFDFGYSKDTLDTYAHWPKDSILGDVVRVVRAFRPHVIVAVWSGTSRDGHGHHQVSGLLAREAYDASGDTVRFPARSHGHPWTTSKFYRTARPGPFGGGATTTAGITPAQAGTIGMDVGEYSPLLGRSYAEIAGESRSQHKSQGFGALQRKGPVMDYVRREATRVNAATASGSETSMFDGMDTTWARFRALDGIPRDIAEVRKAYNPFAPHTLVPPLLRLLRRVSAARAPREGDFASSLSELEIRAANALRLATGITVEALVERELHPLSRDVRVLSTVYNRGSQNVRLSEGRVIYDRGGVTGTRPPRTLPPGGVLRDTVVARFDSVTQAWWLRRGRNGAMFNEPASTVAEGAREEFPVVYYSVEIGEHAIGFSQPIVFRYADDIRGELRVAAAGAPAVGVTLDQRVTYAPANVPLDRDVEVRLSSSDTQARTVRVTLSLPSGLVADSATRTIQLERYGVVRTARFRVRGQLPPGDHTISARAESDGQTYALGSQLIDYQHISRQRIYRPAEVQVSAVDLRVPATLSVAYIAGVSDNVAPALSQLGIPVTQIPAEDVARADLSGYSTLVIGPRAYEAHPELAGANSRILDFARRGGTVVVQFGQYEMMQPGIMPYPITINRPHDRVTLEGSPVIVRDSSARELAFPNRITAADFAGWVQERGLYMPRTFDERYRALFAMSDPGQPPNHGAVLIAPLGEGRYIYTTAAFFRQLPAGVPGAARLFVNLLSAGLEQRRATP